MVQLRELFLPLIFCQPAVFKFLAQLARILSGVNRHCQSKGQDRLNNLKVVPESIDGTIALNGRKVFGDL